VRPLSFVRTVHNLVVGLSLIGVAWCVSVEELAAYLETASLSNQPMVDTLKWKMNMYREFRVQCLVVKNQLRDSRHRKGSRGSLLKQRQSWCMRDNRVQCCHCGVVSNKSLLRIPDILRQCQHLFQIMIGHIGSHGSVRDALGKRRAEDSDIRRPRDTSCSALNARLHHLRVSISPSDTRQVVCSCYRPSSEDGEIIVC
jgi:hypothetical protein